MNLELFSKLWNEKSDHEKVLIINKTSQKLLSSYKSVQKSLKNEMEYGFHRKGVRGGRFTSINAKSQNATRMYNTHLEELRFMVNNI